MPSIDIDRYHGIEVDAIKYDDGQKIHIAVEGRDGPATAVLTVQQAKEFRALLTQEINRALPTKEIIDQIEADWDALGRIIDALTFKEFLIIVAQMSKDNDKLAKWVKGNVK